MTISVLTPSFNSGKFIERAIRSVQNQSYSEWEHIIVDGGSNDETVKILEKHPHLKWLTEPDRGQSDAMNKAFRISTGDLIVYLNADDEFEPDTFEFVVKYFQERPDCMLLVGNLFQIFPDQKFEITPSSDLIQILTPWPPRFPLNPLSYFYKREVQEKIGNFPVANHFSMDYWFLLRAYLKFPIHQTKKVFGKFHFHNANKSSDEKRAKIALSSTLSDFKKEYFGNLLFFKTRWILRKIQRRLQQIGIYG